jgi:hypothetical protein
VFILNKDLFSGILAVITRLSLKGFVEDFLELFIQPKLTIGDISSTSTLFMNTDEPANLGGESGKSTEQTDRTNLEQKVIDSIFTESIKLEFIKFQEEMSK